MQALRCVVFVAFLSAALSGQDPAQNDREINERVQRLRENIVEGRQIRSHVRVGVRLKNGNLLKGVVKDGRLVERVEGLRFVQAEAHEAGAGIRVWYFDNSNNYVFLPFADIADYKVQARLTTQQVQAIELQLVDDARKKQELEELQRQKQAEAEGQTAEPPKDGEQPADGKPAEDKPADAKPADAKPADGKLTDEQAKMFKLLQDYPPQAGWNEAKRDEIKRRLSVVGAKPSAAELRFVESFDQWQHAVSAFGVKSETPAENSEADPKQKSRRR